jgi:hypothetical protein
MVNAMIEMKKYPETNLPKELLQKANLRGNEYAWSLDLMPEVIWAGKEAGLINLGGTLQFRIPEATCECYWVDIDPEIPSHCTGSERIIAAAESCYAKFQALLNSLSLEAEASKFEILRTFMASGGNIEEFACFVWYFSTEEEE